MSVEDYPTPAEVRQEIADAVSSVDGVTCKPYGSPSTTAGTAYVRRGITKPDPFGGLVTWEVVIVLPGQLEAAEKEIDRLIPLLRGALDVTLTDESYEPVSLTFDNKSKPALLVRGTREE